MRVYGRWPFASGAKSTTSSWRASKWPSGSGDGGVDGLGGRIGGWAERIHEQIADKAKTLDLINKGEGGFLDRDLYPFCSNVSDGKTVAVGNPNVAKQVMGVDARTLKDVNGKAFGQELYDAYQKPEGQITEVSYTWVRPGPDKTQVPKVSFATRVGDLGCGVGYYK